MPNVTVNLYNAAPSDFLEFEWHVVFEGIRPGIYPTWYVAIEFLGLLSVVA